MLEERQPAPSEEVLRSENLMPEIVTNLSDVQQAKCRHARRSVEPLPDETPGPAIARNGPEPALTEPGRRTRIGPQQAIRQSPSPLGPVSQLPRTPMASLWTSQAGLINMAHNPGLGAISLEAHRRSNAAGSLR